MNFAVISVSLTFEWCEAIWENDLLVRLQQGAVLVGFSDGTCEFYELKPAKFLNSIELSEFKKKLLYCPKLELEQYIAEFNKPLWLINAERARLA